MSIELPPPPATLEEAMARANFLAYGFAKHTDPAYWRKGTGYDGDPLYYWKRMLGWQLKEDSPDRALYGLYAFPPSPWNGSAVSPPPVVVPPVPDEPGPVPPDLVGLLLARLAVLETAVRALSTKPMPTYEGTIKIPYLGTAPVTLTPKP